MSKLKSSNFIRNFVFGVEDSLVSTVGLVSGIAAAGIPHATLILSGVVLIFVEAFSMAAGSLISENSVEEFNKRKIVSLHKSLAGSLIMFFSYFLSGFVIIVPYLFFNKTAAFIVSIVTSLILLFVLGFYVGKLSDISPVKRGFTIAFVGGAAILIGVVVGGLLDTLLLV